MARRYCQKVFENEFTVELTIRQSSFKIRCQVLKNRVNIHHTGSSFRATDQKLKILTVTACHKADIQHQELIDQSKANLDGQI